MLSDELVDFRAVTDQHLERNIAVQAKRIGKPDHGGDDGNRDEPPERQTALSRSAAWHQRIIGGHVHSGGSRANYMARWRAWWHLTTYTRALGRAKPSH